MPADGMRMSRIVCACVCVMLRQVLGQLPPQLAPHASPTVVVWDVDAGFAPIHQSVVHLTQVCLLLYRHTCA